MPSPNFGERAGGQKPSLVVLHYTAVPGDEAREILCDPARAVSCHWLIHEDGRQEALVDEALRAWHAGAGSWAGQDDVNSRSIGIELVNLGTHPFPEAQMQALEARLAVICATWAIDPRAVIAHADMAPGRKSDPGRRFDWARLARAGFGIWPAGQGDAGRALDASLSVIGYPAADPALRLAAFRLHFHPTGAGPETPEDRARADALARGCA